jgi:hypothetical protein
VNSNIYLVYCKKFCKCHNIPPSSTTILKKRRVELNPIKLRKRGRWWRRRRRRKKKK